METKSGISADCKRKAWCKPLATVIVIDSAKLLCASEVSVQLPHMKSGAEFEEEDW